MTNENQQNSQEAVSMETAAVTEAEVAVEVKEAPQEPEVAVVKRPSLITKEAYLESVRKINNPDFRTKAIEFVSRDDFQDALIEEINKAFSVKRAEAKFELDTNPEPKITIKIDLDKFFTLASKDFSVLSAVGSSVGKGVMGTVIAANVYNIISQHWGAVEMVVSDEAICVTARL